MFVLHSKNGLLCGTYLGPSALCTFYIKHNYFQYLDSMMAQQRQRNPKTVKKLKEKATHDADKCIKSYDKLHQKAQKKAAKVDKILARERGKQGITVNRTHNGTHRPASNGVMKNNKKLNGTTSLQNTDNNLSDPKPFSAHLTLSPSTSRNIISGVAKRIMQKQRGTQLGGSGILSIM